MKEAVAVLAQENEGVELLGQKEKEKAAKAAEALREANAKAEELAEQLKIAQGTRDALTVQVGLYGGL